MARNLDGCAEFDERLIEQAFSPSPDAELDRHLVACPRCRAARERYLATGDALGAALAVVPDSRGAAPVRRRSRRPLLIAACAAALVILVIVLSRSRQEREFTVQSIEGEVNFAEDPGHVRVDLGRARFDVERGPLVVDTPLGVARCDSGSFTLSVAREGGIESMNKKHAALAVTITVTAGIVWWAAGGHEVEVDSASPWVERETTATAPPDLSSLERSGGARSPEQRASLLAEPAVEIAPDPAVGAQPDRKYEIHGRVVDAETGEPLPSAHVTLGDRRPEGRAFAAFAVSGKDGRFRSTSVALPRALPIRPGVAVDAFFVGTYLVAECEGFASRYEIPWERFYDAGSALDAREPIDLGEIRLHRGVRVAGRVVDERGEPVADAALLLSEGRPGSAAFTPATAEEVARSGADGSFSLARSIAPAGEHAKIHLFAVAPIGIGWVEIDVLDGKRESGELLVRIEAPARLEVLVQDVDGKPIAGADVSLEPRFEPLLTPRYGRLHDHAMFMGARPDIWSLFQAKTDARGRARFERVPTASSEGTYDVVVTAKDFARDWKDDVLVLASRDTNAVVVLEIFKPRSISGTVRSEDGSPVAGVKVDTHSGGQMLSTSTDAAGAYRFEGLDPSIEDGWFALDAPGFVEIRRSVPLPSRGDLEGIDFVLAAPRAIAGRIVDQDGMPVAGARPRLFRSGEWRTFRGEQGQTGADGAFRFDDATSGSWTLSIQPPEPLSDWLSPNTMLEVKGGDDALDVVMGRARNEGARVVAEIVDAASGEPLDPMAAEMWPQGRWPEDSRRTLPALVRGAGRVTADPVDPGSWRLWVRVEGRATAFADFKIDPGQRVANVRVPVGREASLVGRVLFDEDVPFREIVIDAQVGDSGVAPSGPEWSAAGASVTKAELPIAPDGTFRLDRATPGNWLLNVRANGVLGHGKVDVPSGGEGRGELRPIAGGLLAFRGNDVAPKGGLRVELRIAEGESGNDTYVRQIEVAEGAFFEHEATVWAGAVRWNLVFRAMDDPLWKRSDGLAQPQGGSMRVAAGEVARIPVPIVLRD
ncbi:MAG: carboxypeptidase regulatory-like domain-containing protein [Planctomycetota bacterium]